MGRCKGLSIIACLILALNSSAQTINLEASEVVTYTFNPSYASWPTFHDTGDMIGNFPQYQAHFAFDLSSIPYNSTIVSATFSAYFYNGSTVASQRHLYYNPDDNWTHVVYTQDPGESVTGSGIIGTLWHSDSPDDSYVWKTITISYNGWANDIADGIISMIVTDGQSGAVGITPGNTGYNWGVLKEPELTLTVVSNPTPITVVSPNGGESFQAGALQTITWLHTSEAGSNVKIELYKDGSSLLDIALSTLNDGEITWMIPSTLLASSKYKVKITDTSDSSKYDFSNNNFSITDSSPDAGSLQFISPAYLISEKAGSVRIYVTRIEGSFGVASVSYQTSNGTALAGSDYTQTSGLLVWADEDTNNKYIDIPITNDSINESEESFTVTLKNAIGATLGSLNQTTVIISDNDQPSSDIKPPAVNTLQPVDLTSDTATLVGFLKSDGSDTTDENCICSFSYWKSGDTENVTSTEWQNGINQDENFSATISGLDTNTIYVFYAQAGNSAGTVNGNAIKFKTLPDPNLPPAAFEPNEPNTLLIQNFVKLFYDDPNWPHKNQGLLTYVEKEGNLNAIDYNDVFYSNPAAGKSSKITSLIPIQKPKGQVTGFYELSKDVRIDNAQDAFLELNIYSLSLNEPNIDSENYLKFWVADNAFKGKPVTIQIESTNPNYTYPVWDINEIINKNGRKMPLDDLIDQMLNSPYAWLNLSTSRQILDINDDGIFNLDDYNLLLADYDKKGIFRSDIASTKNDVTVLGIPDGKVDITDENAFIAEYNKMYPDNPIPENVPAFFEGFESGSFNPSFISYGSALWTRSNDSYRGSFCAVSGNIDDNQGSALEITIEIPKGRINFWFRVSSELNYDALVFSIDNVQKGKWSGFMDWQEVSYQTTPGTHTLRWAYIKDNSTSHGQDSAWLDNISLQ